jgi:hypothetical protein
MKPIMIVGCVLLMLGVAALGYQGVAYITTRETVAEVGPIRVQADRERAIPLWPILSGVALVGGLALLVIGASKAKET